MMRSKSLIATPPGATIREQLTDRKMSQKEFAARMDMTEKHISNLINGDVQLTPDVALRLEMVLGIPAKFWNNLEFSYREKLIRIENENRMDADIETVKKMPYNEIAKLEWVPSANTVQNKVEAMRKFFEVVHLGLLHKAPIIRIACRRLSETEKSDYALLVWAQKAKLEARQMNTKRINIDKLATIIPELRKLTKCPPEQFCPKLTEMLADCGVALVLLPHIGGSFLHGATFYDANKIVLGLTVRGAYADKFWFSLFHEIAHIIYGHIGQPDGTTEQDEKAADEFARTTLIPDDAFAKFVSKQDSSPQEILSFANSIDIDAGIVVGRLQKEGIISYAWHNKMKKQYYLSN